MSYKVVKTDDRFDVIELKTDQVVFTSNDHDTAHARYRFFKDGGGFAGFTPTFILRGYKNAD